MQLGHVWTVLIAMRIEQHVGTDACESVPPASRALPNPTWSLMLSPLCRADKEVSRISNRIDIVSGPPGIAPLAMAPEERTVKDTRLYDVLGVSPTATTHEISVAYRRKREQVRVRRRRRPLSTCSPSPRCR